MPLATFYRLMCNCLPIITFVVIGVNLTSLKAQQSLTPSLRIEGQGRLDGSAVISADKRDRNGQQVAAIRLVTNLSALSIEASYGVVGDLLQETGGFVVYISPNERKLRVSATGYLPVDIILAEVGIRLESGQLWELTVTGEQQVDTIPVNFVITPNDAGVQLFVDGVVQEKLTNIPIAVGQHIVRLEMTGFKTINETINVSSTQSLFNYQMQSIDPQVVSFASTPTGATVYVDEIEIGQTPVQAFYTPTEYSVEWRLSGYLPASQRITVTEGGTNSFNQSLTKNTGALSWSIAPADAQISINSAVQTAQQAELAPGLYKVEISAEGYDPITEMIELKRGQSLQKAWKLTQQLGGLQFSVQPSTAKIELLKEEQVVESWTGLKFSRSLPVGSYTLKAKADGYKSTEQSLIISRDEIKELSIELEEGRDDVDYTNSIGMEFVYVAPGSFQMGSNNGQNNEKPVHKVEITQGYYIGKYEVTQAQWQAVMGSNPSGFKGDSHPVEQVSWNDIQTFVQRLNAREGGTRYRLPTEAEWEYAARGGNKSQGYTYAGSNDLDRVGWYNDNSGSETHPVGQKAPNELGIYDMSGNVWEWVNDWYSSSYYSQSPRQDPKGPNSGQYRVLRGGSWDDNGSVTRVAFRNDGNPAFRGSYHGFRLLRIQN